MKTIWEYQDAMQPGDWDNHIGYLYRELPKVGDRGASALCQFTTPLDIFWVKEKFGGVQFRAILKKGPTRVADTHFVIEAPPKMQTDPTNYSSVATAAAPTDATRHAMDLIADPSGAKNAVALTAEAARAGFDMLRGQMASSITGQLSVKDIIDLMDRRNASASGMPPWLEQALAAAVPALLARLLTPENPIETFTKYMSILQNSPFGKGSGGVDWKASLVEVLPSIAERAADMMQSYRGTVEAAAGAAARQLPPAPPTQPNPAARPGPQAVPNPPAPNGATPSAATPAPDAVAPPPPEVWLKTKLRDLFREGRPGDEVGAFLDMTAPQWLGELASLAPATIVGFMRGDPILHEVADDPKMLPFLESLIAWAKDVDDPLITSAVVTAAKTQTPA